MAVWLIIPIGKRPKGTYVCERKASPVAPVKMQGEGGIYAADKDLIGQ